MSSRTAVNKLRHLRTSSRAFGDRLTFKKNEKWTHLKDLTKIWIEEWINRLIDDENDQQLQLLLMAWWTFIKEDHFVVNCSFNITRSLTWDLSLKRVLTSTAFIFCTKTKMRDRRQTKKNLSSFSFNVKNKNSWVIDDDVTHSDRNLRGQMSRCIRQGTESRSRREQAETRRVDK